MVRDSGDKSLDDLIDEFEIYLQNNITVENELEKEIGHLEIADMFTPFTI